MALFVWYSDPGQPPLMTRSSGIPSCVRRFASIPKLGYLGDSAGHWHPHQMFFSTHTHVADWGADLHGSPVFAAQTDSDPVTTFFVLVSTWSDGTPAATEAH